MGPYCNFCGRRCFVHFPNLTPGHILKAYGTSNIIATCDGGQRFEKKKIGYCYDDIIDALLPCQDDSCPNCARPLPLLDTARCPDCGEPLTRQARLREAVGEEKTD